MVGRERELELLEQALERSVASGRCSLVTLLGHAGVGKSRLAREFIARSAGRAVAVSGRCPPYGEDITFWPIAEVVRELGKIDDSDSPETVHQKLLTLVGATEEAAAIVEGVASAVGPAEPTAQRAEIFWAVRRLLEEISRRVPLIVVIDDVHWAAPTLLDLVEDVADTSQGQPILLLCLARPELGEQWPALRAPDPPAQVITLGRLNEGDSSALVEQLLAGGELPDEVRARLAAAADGNPLFLEQLVHMLDDDGELRQIEGRWSFASELPELSLPPTIHAIVAARLHRLPPGERAVVECASVVGQEFWPTVVGELMAQPEAGEADLHLESLLDKELIRAGSTRLAGEQALRFSHIVIRDVAYQTILKDTRARLHESVASWLQGRAGERAGEYEELLGYHLEQAYRHHADLGRPAAHAAKLGKQAAERIGSAGRRALARGDMPAATSLLERAVSLLPEADSLRSELSLRLSIALAETGELKRADALLSERIAAERRGQHYLLYRDGEGRQGLHDIDAAKAPITIGRRAINDIALGWDGEVSRSHAYLEWAAGEWALVDKGLSSNGSYVNGQRVEGRHQLHDGDVLRFGKTVLLFRAPLGSDVRFRRAAESASTATRPVPRGL